MKWALSLACLFVVVGNTPAALDPEYKTPYQLQIVLHLPQNRALTAIFQEQLQRELHDVLQLSFGPLARVEVVREHALLAEIEANGLAAAVLRDEHLNKRRTSFLLVDFAVGVYHLQTRYLDGMTGLASATVHEAQTSDPGMVCLLAAELIEADFSLVGTVVSSTENEVTLGLKGGQLGVPLSRWVKPGDAFALCRIIDEGDRERARRVEWTLLEASETPSNGQLRCRLWQRFQNELNTVGTIDYRALELHTVKATLRIQLVDEKSLKPLDNVRVKVLKPNATKGIELVTTRAGMVVTHEAFDHMALVQVYQGDHPGMQFPVEIVEGNALVYRLNPSAGSEAEAALEMRTNHWLRRLTDIQRIVSERNLETNRRTAKSLADGLQFAKEKLRVLDEELAESKVARSDIVGRAVEIKVDVAKFDLGTGDAVLDSLKARREEMSKWIDANEKAIQEANSPENVALVGKLAQAQLLEKQADFDKAIVLYEEVSASRPDNQKVKDELGRLRGAWKIKSPEHAQARAFLYDVWPTLEVTKLQANLDKAAQALATCKTVGDKLTPLKFIQANFVHANNLKRRLDALKSQQGDDQRAELKTIASTAERVQQLHTQATELVRAGPLN